MINGNDEGSANHSGENSEQWWVYMSCNFEKITVLVLILIIQTSCVSKKKTEGQKVIETFYQTYFDTLNDVNLSKPSLSLSGGFSDLIAKNRLVCKAKAGSDICGWDALHGDDYLNAPEIDSDLNYENSKFKSSEPKQNRVRVEFNVMPSAKTNKASYLRVIEYVMINEGTNWMVDDIITEGKSLRQTLTDEIEYYNNNSSGNNIDHSDINNNDNISENGTSRSKNKNHSTKNTKGRSKNNPGKTKDE